MRGIRGIDAGRALTLGWILLCVAPLGSAIAMIRDGWAPVIDNALIAAHTIDSLSLDPPLVGNPTTLGFREGEQLNHAGPLGFWLLAIPAKVFGAPGSGLVIGSWILTALSVATLGVLLRRRGDRMLEGLTLVLMAAMMASLGGSLLSTPFNPYIALLPTVVCLVAAAGVLAGHHRQLWVMVLAGSLAAQAHLGNVPLIGGIVLLVVAGLGYDVARSSGPERDRLVKRIVPVGVLLGLAAWIGPIIDQLFGTQNLSRLVASQSDDRTVVGAGHGLDTAVEMTSVPPRWMVGHAVDRSLADPGLIRVVPSALCVALVIGLGVWSFRRRDRGLASLVLLSLVTLLVATVTTARLVKFTPTPFFVVENAVLYRLLWWPVGLLFAVTATWGLTHVLREARAQREDTVDETRLGRWQWRPSALEVSGLAVVIVLVTVPIAYNRPFTALEPFFSSEFAHADAIDELLASESVVVMRFAPTDAPSPAPDNTGGDEGIPGVWDLGPNGVYGTAINLIAQLRLRGIVVRFPDESAQSSIVLEQYQDTHRVHGDEEHEVLYVAGPAAVDDPPDGYRLLSDNVDEETAGALLTPTAIFVAES